MLDPQHIFGSTVFMLVAAHGRGVRTFPSFDNSNFEIRQLHIAWMKSSAR
jgi:hypothetical protein